MHIVKVECHHWKKADAAAAYQQIKDVVLERTRASQAKEKSDICANCDNPTVDDSVYYDDHRVKKRLVKTQEPEQGRKRKEKRRGDLRQLR
jgi:predicted carbohydrate-binding protein with CBM5 and CBM33 domain